MPLFLSGSQMVFWPHQGWGLEVDNWHHRCSLCFHWHRVGGRGGGRGLACGQMSSLVRGGQAD